MIDTFVVAILVIPLAVWRVCNMLSDTTQSGPFGVLDWLRNILGVKYDELSIPYAKKGSLAEMLLCVYCNSIWVGIFFTVAFLVNQIATIILSLPLALSAVAIFLEEWRIKNGKD